MDTCVCLFLTTFTFHPLQVTHCRHFFHGLCLRKWLYMQDSCPLCHSPLYRQQSDSTEGADDGNEDRNNNLGAENHNLEVRLRVRALTEAG
jgi:E3 ubiquitin-protein ligase RNF139